METGPVMLGWFYFIGFIALCVAAGIVLAELLDD